MILIIISRLLLMLGIAGVIGWKFASLVSYGFLSRYAIVDICIFVVLLATLFMIAGITVRQHTAAVRRSRDYMDALEARLAAANISIDDIDRVAIYPDEPLACQCEADRLHGSNRILPVTSEHQTV